MLLQHSLEQGAAIVAGIALSLHRQSMLACTAPMTTLTLICRASMACKGLECILVRCRPYLASLEATPILNILACMGSHIDSRQ